MQQDNTKTNYANYYTSYEEYKNRPHKKRGIGSLVKLLRYLKFFKLQAVLVIITSIVSNLLLLVIPQLAGYLLDELQKGFSPKVWTTLISGSIGIMIVAVLSWIVAIIQGRLLLYIAQNLVLRLRHDVFDKLMELPVSYFDKRAKGDIISVVSTDIDNISDTVSSDLVTLISGFVTVIGALILMLAISPTLSTIFIVTVPAMYIIARIISKKARYLHGGRKAALGALTGYAEEMISAQTTITTYGLEESNKETFAGYARELRERGWRAEFQSSRMMPTLNGINNLNFTLICALGAVLALNGSITIGNITAFVMYSKRFANPIVESANIINMFQTALAACDRVFGILDADSEPSVALPKDMKSEQSDNSRRFIEAGKDLTMKTEIDASVYAASPLSGTLSISHVDFSYTPEKQILKDISVDIRPGMMVAIVGQTGSGKTTLANLLMRYYDNYTGSITIGGRETKDIPLEQLRSFFALILQDSWLFEGTVYENIGYAAKREIATKENIEKICKNIHVDSFIRTLPNGYNTVLRNDSGSLSQGQKQLLNIARAFLCNPSFFILDEATSSVDPMLEAQLQETTNRVIKGKSSIIIAHRLSTILNADLILVMDNGRIVERGTHKELLMMDGVYKQLYESQFASE